MRGLQYIGAHEIFVFYNYASEHDFEKIPDPNSVQLSLIEPLLCDSKEIFSTYESILEDKYLRGSNVLGPGLHFIGA